MSTCNLALHRLVEVKQITSRKTRPNTPIPNYETTILVGARAGDMFSNHGPQTT